MSSPHTTINTKSNFIKGRRGSLFDFSKLRKSK